MDKDTARIAADALTWSRIASVVPITLCAGYGFVWWAFGLYIAAALTDLFDGWFARRGAPPRIKLDLDGVADLLFSGMTLVWLWLLVPGFFAKYWPYFPVLIGLELYMTPVRLRWPEVAVPHLQFGRFAMAFFMFLLPVLIVWGDVAWFVHAVLLTGVAAKVQLAVVMTQRLRRLRDARAAPS